MKGNKSILLILVLFFIGCANVKPYHKAKLNHEDMQMGEDGLESHESHAHNYREGASGGTNGNTGGGCGCN